MTGTANDGEFQEFIDPKNQFLSRRILKRDYTKKIHD
jgi:hypothetical protein